MKRVVVYFLLLALPFGMSAQYSFTAEQSVECTAVKNQQRTGTCWSFSTVSFLESELIRMGKPSADLSEMHIVRTIYKDKAQNYVLRQGKANFSQGSLAHDVIRAFKKGGIVPESVYSGKLETDIHDHNEMEAVLKGVLDGAMKSKKMGSKWRMAFHNVLDSYIGETPAQFEIDGKKMDAKMYGKSLGINPADYVSFSSYTHHPFYESFILEVPDNYSNGSFHNLPIAELQAIVDNALAKGYTLAWDGDVTEKGFKSSEGIAVLPTDEKRKDLFEQPGEEVAVTQELRQRTFESFETTDDHLMHIVGKAKDQNGTPYYLIKNSWGERSDYKGFLYMSEAYFQLKTVSVLVHKDAVPAAIAKKLAL